MKLFLAGTNSRGYMFEDIKPKFVLESFYYIQDWQVKKLHEWEMFLLDSGAFTFLTSKKNTKIDWEEYIERYAHFINENNIQYFFELDIDSVVGYSKVLEYRNLLETKTKKSVSLFGTRAEVLKNTRNFVKNMIT